VGSSFDAAGSVTVSNPTASSWVLREVVVEAVRLGEATPVLTQRAR
jgi:hypothetical protein